jgi:4-amino-4-deoxy-L-arabinose transferase-like glycosyltransferase
VGGVLRTDPFWAARWIGALLFGLNIVLVGLIVNSISRHSAMAAVGGALMLISPVMLYMHTETGTEPLFLLLVFVGLYGLAKYLKTQNLSLLILSSVAFALGCLTRYAGGAVIVAAVVGILLLSKQSHRRRFVDSLIMAGIGLAPLAAFVVRNVLIAGNATNREIQFHPITTRHLETALSHASSWFAAVTTSDPLGSVLRAFLSFLVLVGCIVLFRRLLSAGVAGVESSDKNALIGILMVFCVSYVLFLVVSISFIDAATPLDSRILSPIYVAGMILGIWMADRVLTGLAESRWVKTGFAVAFGLFVGVYVLRTVAWDMTWIRRSYEEGGGYVGRQWRESQIVEHLRSLPQNVMVYSNLPGAVYFLAGKPSTWVPEKFDDLSLKANGRYGIELNKMERDLRGGRAVLAYFKKADRPHLPTIEELNAGMGLAILKDGEEGAIFRSPDR